MSDKIVVMKNGEIQQIGSPQDIYNEPANRFVANFIGESNILSGTMIDDYKVMFDDIVFDCVDYGFKKNDPMELVSLRLSVVGEMDKSNLYSKGEISKELPKPEEIRKAYFMGEWLDTAVYKRDALKAGNSFIGPAIIEETGATSVVGPGDKVTVDERMNLVVKIANHETGKMEALEEN